MTSYLCWEPRMELLGLRAIPQMEPRRCWASPNEIFTAATYMLLFPLVYLRMESTKKMDCPSSPMQPTEKQGFPGWNLYCSVPNWCYFFELPVNEANRGEGLPPDGTCKEAGLPRIKPTLQPSTCCSLHWATSRQSTKKNTLDCTRICCCGWNEHLR